VDKIEQQKIKEAKELLERYAPKGEFLAYINKKEAGLLKAYGGAGKPIEQTEIPSYFIFTASGALAAWVLPTMIGASAVASFMGSLHQARNLRRSMKADQRNAEERALQLGFIAAQKGRKKLSLQRAMTGISGTQMGTGSNLLNKIATIKGIEQAEYFASRNLYLELDDIDARGTSLLAKNAFDRNTSLLGSLSSLTAAGYKSGLFTTE
jgi:hypothetical protein